jgi:VCBS repeat-containing protein
MDYEKLVYTLGKLHRTLRELEADGQHQGEHTIVYTTADGATETVHVYIDGTDLQMTRTPGGDHFGLDVHIDA